MTRTEEFAWWSKLLGQLGSILIWLGIVLLICLPLLVAAFK
jgi:hypothetical protein